MLNTTFKQLDGGSKKLDCLKIDNFHETLEIIMLDYNSA